MISNRIHGSLISNKTATDHAILFSQLDCTAGVSFEQRSAKSTLDCRLLLNDRLQLFVVAHQNDLVGRRRHNWNEAFRFLAHRALVYDQLQPAQQSTLHSKVKSDVQLQNMAFAILVFCVPNKGIVIGNTN